VGNLERVVIVGASAAGVTTAETLRREGYTGRLTLVGDEKVLPYDRPPLSKQVLAGTWEQERTALRPASAYADHDIELKLGTPASGLDLEHADQLVLLAQPDDPRDLGRRRPRPLPALHHAPDRVGAEGLDVRPRTRLALVPGVRVVHAAQFRDNGGSPAPCS
jgi:hypothetical protein